MGNKSNEIKDVQPIRDLEQIENMKWALKRFCGERDYILFCLGINTGLRITDLLQLKTKDVKGKKSITVIEGKTKKKRKVLLEAVYEELNAYISTLKGTEWLFPSRKGDNPITRIQAYQQFKKASEMAGVEAVGTHTLRKTFGYWFYKQYKDVAMLQSILNHSKPDVTLRYIGITQEDIENKLQGFKL
jgi:integrase